MQAARISASVLYMEVGKVGPLAGAVWNWPLKGLTSEEDSAKAAERAVGLVVRFAPMWVPSTMNCFSAITAATVVSSLMLTKVLAVRLPQVPSSDIIDRPELFVPDVSPGLPPVAIRYTSVPGVGQV